MSDIENTDSTEESTETIESTAEKANTDWVKEAKKWEKRSVENYRALQEAQEAAAKWKEYQETQKTESEKTAERLAKAESDARAAQQELIRFRIAAEKGLTPELVSRLRGDTEEELAADADSLITLFGGVTPASKKSVQPVKTQGLESGTPKMTARQAFIEAFDNQ
jgi:hypothetical protein